MLADRRRGIGKFPRGRPALWAPLVSMLLSGGCGYEELRLHSPLAVDRRVRSPVRPHRRIRSRLTDEDNYPPYNIERTGEDNYRVSLALAGFKPDEITVTAEQNMFTVEGRKADKADREYLYQGIAGRPFSAPVQPRRLRRGEGRIVRERAAADRLGTRAAGGHEAAPDRDQVRRTGKTTNKSSKKRWPERLRRCRPDQVSRARLGRAVGANKGGMTMNVRDLIPWNRSRRRSGATCRGGQAPS